MQVTNHVAFRLFSDECFFPFSTFVTGSKDAQLNRQINHLYCSWNQLRQIQVFYTYPTLMGRF
jgi:hypothetical protein